MIEYFKVKDLSTFGNVFGAQCFIEYWPEILTTGIRVQKGAGRRSDWWYVVDEQGKKIHDTSFFTEEDMQYLEKVDDPTRTNTAAS